MKFELNQRVIVNGKEATVSDYNMRHGEYTVQFTDGTREYGVKENEIKSA